MTTTFKYLLYYFLLDSLISFIFNLLVVKDSTIIKAFLIIRSLSIGFIFLLSYFLLCISLNQLGIKLNLKLFQLLNFVLGYVLIPTTYFIVFYNDKTLTFLGAYKKIHSNIQLYSMVYVPYILGFLVLYFYYRHIENQQTV